MPPRVPICRIMDHPKAPGDARMPAPRSETATVAAVPTPAKPAKETGGPKGPEPTRYGDWERNGRCIDF
jgi:hypothetical protein